MAWLRRVLRVAVRLYSGAEVSYGVPLLEPDHRGARLYGE